VPSKEGKDSQSPHLLAITKCAQIMLRTTDHLGFSPASRTRVSAGGTNDSTFGAWEDVTA
jgi:phage terminase small subunit